MGKTEKGPNLRLPIGHRLTSNVLLSAGGISPRLPTPRTQKPYYPLPSKNAQQQRSRIPGADSLTDTLDMAKTWRESNFSTRQEPTSFSKKATFRDSNVANTTSQTQRPIDDTFGRRGSWCCPIEQPIKAKSNDNSSRPSVKQPQDRNFLGQICAAEPTPIDDSRVAASFKNRLSQIKERMSKLDLTRPDDVTLNRMHVLAEEGPLCKNTQSLIEAYHQHAAIHNKSTCDMRASGVSLGRSSSASGGEAPPALTRRMTVTNVGSRNNNSNSNIHAALYEANAVEMAHSFELLNVYRWLCGLKPIQLRKSRSRVCKIVHMLLSDDSKMKHRGDDSHVRDMRKFGNILLDYNKGKNSASKTPRVSLFFGELTLVNAVRQAILSRHIFSPIQIPHVQFGSEIISTSSTSSNQDLIGAKIKFNSKAENQGDYAKDLYNHVNRARMMLSSGEIPHCLLDEQKENDLSVGQQKLSRALSRLCHIGETTTSTSNNTPWQKFQPSTTTTSRAKVTIISNACRSPRVFTPRKPVKSQRVPAWDPKKTSGSMYGDCDGAVSLRRLLLNPLLEKSAFVRTGDMSILWTGEEVPSNEMEEDEFDEDSESDEDSIWSDNSPHTSDIQSNLDVPPPEVVVFPPPGTYASVESNVEKTNLQND